MDFLDISNYNLFLMRSKQFTNDTVSEGEPLSILPLVMQNFKKTS